MMPPSRSAATPTRGHVLRIALPLILSNLSVPLLGMVDTAVVGHMGEVYFLGAVAVGANVFSVLFLGLNFLRMATTGLASQALGAADGDRLRVLLAQGLLVALACALVLWLAQVPLRELAMTALGVQDQVGDAARAYFDVRIWSAPFVLCNFVFAGWLVGLGSARAVLALTLAINVGNILLDVLFVYGFGWGLEGVAAATVLAECGGALVGSIAVAGALGRHRARHLSLRSVRTWREALEPASLRRLLALNTHLLIRTLALQFVFVVLTGRGTRLGETVLAINAVLLTWQYAISYGLDGFAQAVESLVGRGLGARSPDAVRRAVRFGFEWALGVAVLASALVWCFGGVASDMLTDQVAVREGVRRYLPWLALSPLVSLWSFIYDGVFVGATAARAMRNVMVLSAFAVFVPAMWLLAPWGNHGLWGAFTLFMLTRAVAMHVAYPRAVLAQLPEALTPKA
ncbi:MAG: MATE family efflux transporter [Pseudomonadota bacterium]